MKINCVLIGLTLCVAGCGGGGGSGAAGGISVQTPAPIAFSSGTTVLSEDKMHISVDGVLRTLAAPDWQNNLAQHTGSDHAYIARRDQNYVAIAGQFDETPFVEVLGNLEPKGRASVLRYDGQLDIRSETFSGAVDIGLHVNLGSEFPRLTTYESNLNIDVAASINSDGSFSHGYVTFLNDQAELKGGFFNTDSEKQNETLAGAFAADTFYGTLLGQVAE
jgi:hypothetical protein